MKTNVVDNKRMSFVYVLMLSLNFLFCSCEKPYQLKMVSKVDSIGSYVASSGDLPPKESDTPEPEVTPKPEVIPDPEVTPDPVSDSGLYGHVRDALTGEPISNVTIHLRARPDEGSVDVQTQTDEGGFYSIDSNIVGNYYLDFEAPTYISVFNRPTQIVSGQKTQENLSMTGAIDEKAVRITVTWTQLKYNAVRDVDSYLKISGIEDPLGYPFKGIDYFNHKLDRDDINWGGPETITIQSLDPSKTYHYYVNNYNTRSNKSALGNSEITVSVYAGAKLLREYKVPEGYGTTYSLFKIINAQVVDTMNYDDSLRVYSF
jgi:hypothetical protein